MEQIIQTDWLSAMYQPIGVAILSLFVVVGVIVACCLWRCYIADNADRERCNLKYLEQSLGFYLGNRSDSTKPPNK